MTASSEAEYSYIVPFFKDVFLDFGFWFVFISIFILVGSSNAVNLTDGLDGLAILPVIIITAALGVIAWASGNVIAADYLYIPFVEGTGELLVLCEQWLEQVLVFYGLILTQRKYLWGMLGLYLWVHLLH